MLLQLFLFYALVAKVKAFIPPSGSTISHTARRTNSSSSPNSRLRVLFLLTESSRSRRSAGERRIPSSPKDSSSASFSVPPGPNPTEVSTISQLPLPPNNGFNIFRNIRDTFSYLASPKRFLTKRSAELGPTFVAYLFFKPTVFVGDPSLVQEFIKTAERINQVIYPALPDTFLELHTKWGSLNLDINDSLFKEARSLFGDVLSSREALGIYTDVLEEAIENYTKSIESRVRANPEEVIYIVPELLSLSLQCFSVIFSGKGLTKEEEQLFIEYNTGLLALSSGTKEYINAKNALGILKEEMLKRFRALDDVTDMSVPGKFYHSKVFGRPGFEDVDRIGTGIVLFIWGAYVESTSLMATSLANIGTNKDPNKVAIQQVYIELESMRQNTDYDMKDYKFWSGLLYSEGVIRESLRLDAPGGGIPRFAKDDFQLGNYRIPVEMPVTLEPRIINMNPDIHSEPNKFEPLRWVKKDLGVIDGMVGTPNSKSSCPFQGLSSDQPGFWFPGGNGAHKCPGVPIGELAGKMIIAKMATKFDSWQIVDGLTKDGSEIDFVNIPVKIPPNSLGMKFHLREEA